MAIFHLTATVISRARGQSAVAAAAYRSGTKLRDERYGTTHHYAGRTRVAHSEIIAPVGTPAWAHDRQALWNRVESAELRKDSQLARVIEVALPIELTPEECLALVRDYVSTVFVSKGMIADFGIRRDNPENPRVHILLTLRDVTVAGFGPKARRWNGKANLLEWRSAWAERTNEHLARAGYSVRIDHRTLEAQRIELTPARRMGIGRPAKGDDDLPSHLTLRREEQRRIARDNGEAMLQDPALLLRAITQQRSSFTLHDLARFLRPRTDGSEQFEAVYLAVARSEELVALSPGDDEAVRYTSRDMIEAAESLGLRAVSMAARRGHGLSSVSRDAALSQFPLSDEQRRSFDYLTGEGDVKAVVLGSSHDKDGLVAASRRAWEIEGLRVLGVTVSRIASDRLLAGSGVESRSLASRAQEWQQGRDLPGRASVLVVDEAELIGLKPLERLLAVADKARAKVVLLGDAARLHAMKAEVPFQGVLIRIASPDA